MAAIGFEQQSPGASQSRKIKRGFGIHHLILCGVHHEHLGLIDEVLRSFSGIADFSEIQVNVTGGSMAQTA